MIHIGIDMNFLAFAEFAIFSNYGKSKKPLESKEDQINFMHGLAGRLFYTISSLPKGGRLFVCIDSRSWRKDIDRSYKEKREDSEGNKGIMDAESKKIFYQVLSDFGDVLKMAGIHVSKVSGAEGDDLLRAWVDMLNSQGDGCIIVSGDRDLTQLIRENNNPWNIVWNPKKDSNKIYASNGWIESLKEVSENSIFDFSVGSGDEDMLKKIRESNPKIEYVKPKTYVFKKILIGDDGDDVPSCWSMIKNGRSVRLTPKVADNVMDNIIKKYNGNMDGLLDLISDDVFLDDLSGIILRIMGDVDDQEKRKELIKNIRTNEKLVRLKGDLVPFNIEQAIQENIRSEMKNEQFRDKWNKNKIFEGTAYQHSSNTPRNVDPFRHMKIPE